MERDVRIPYVVLSGLGAVLVTWMLVMPPSGGLDEFDHIYRAAAVSRGEWIPSPSGSARGDYVDVPADIVAAVQPQCQALNYTSYQDCVGTPHGSDRRVVSGAARYHPAFYLLVGILARPFHGTPALYVMRLATAVLALLFVALALVALNTWRQSRTAYLGVVLACTPMLAYSSSIVAPNGVEMTAALAFWVSLIGLLVADDHQLRRVILVAAISGAALATVRSLGPLWCVLIVVAVVIGVRARRGRARMLLRRPDALLGAGAVLLSAAQNTAWVQHMGTLQITEVAGTSNTATSLDYRLGKAGVAVPVWLLQTIGGFPMRNATYPSVYACYVVVFVALITMAVRMSDRRLRVALGGVAITGLLIPIVATVRTFDSLDGVAWQGRYELPLVIGLVVLAAYGLDTAGVRVTTPTRAICGVLFVLAHVVSVAYTLNLELERSPLVHSSEWLRPPMWAVVALSAVGAVAMWSASFGERTLERGHNEADFDTSEPAGTSS